MEYRMDDQALNASIFLSFVNRIWPGEYDMDQTQTALSKTLNITAYDDKVLVGFKEENYKEKNDKKRDS